ERSEARAGGSNVDFSSTVGSLIVFGARAGPASRARQKRKLSAHNLVVAEVGICASCADPNFASNSFNPTQFRKVPDADQLPRREPPRGILHHHIGSPSDGQPFPGFLRQQRENCGKRAGCGQLVLGWTSPHPAIPRRPTSATASIICA